MDSGFVELLARSCFSFLRGASHPHELVEQARKKGLAGLAICDEGGLYGAVQTYQAGSEAKVRTFVGAELPLREGELSLALIARTHEGYTNLCWLISHAEQELSLHDYRAHAKGLIAIAIPPQAPSSLLQSAQADELLLELREIWGADFYVAIYRHLDGQDRPRRRLVQRWAQATGAKILASGRPLYHVPARKPLADTLYCISKNLLLEEAGQALSPNEEAYLRSEAEMLTLFSDHPEWVQQTREVAAKVEFQLDQLQYHFPCALPENLSADDYLRQLVEAGSRRRFPEGLPQKVQQQVERELGLIAKLQLAPYFISTYQIVEIARRREILCQGRGSAANSAVCYLLGITAVDPSRSHLLFERFLSEERAEPPDIDIDFEHGRREEVIQEIYATYGRERAAMISEVVRFRRRSALRDVAKIFGFSPEQQKKISQSVRYDGSELLEEHLVEQGLNPQDQRLALVFGLAEQLQGFPRHLSIHVGGFVLSSRPLYEVAPLRQAKMPGRTLIPWDKDDIEVLGFFKIDILSLGMLTAIRKSLQSVFAEGGLPPATCSQKMPTTSAQEMGRQWANPLELLARIPAEDKATFDMICRADTMGVFQIESRAQMAMLPRLRPRQFFDLVVEVAIVRPGPIQGKMVHPYLRRRNGQEAILAPHPDLAPIVERTLGIPLFQEQVMQIAMVGAGYQGGEADQLRRDMAAWKKHGRLERHRQRLIDGFRDKGIAEEFALALFEQIKGFGEYGFPESHASSFALLVYASAWLKCHYPAHFCVALLNSQPMGFYQPTSLVQDAQRHGVDVLDICILESDWDCTLVRPEGSGATHAPSPTIRLGFRILKGFSQKGAERWIQMRKGRTNLSLRDLRRCLGQSDVELLAEAGALSALVAERRAALWQASAPELGPLFQTCEEPSSQIELSEMRQEEQLVLDYERKGLSVGDHPLRYYRKRLKAWGAARASDLPYLPKGRAVSLGGLVLSRQRPATAQGVVFMTLEDETGSINLIVYAKVFERYHRIARFSSLLYVTGLIEREERLPLPAPHTSTIEVDGVTTVPVVHVIAHHFEELSKKRQLLRSRNFH